MQKLELYTGEKIYVAPNGEIDTKENILRKFPAALTIKHVVLTDDGGEVSYGVMILSSLCSQYGVDQSLSVEEKISKLEEIMNVPQSQQAYEESAEYQLKLREVEALETANNIALSQMVLEVKKGTVTAAQFEAATGTTVGAIEEENIARVTSLKVNPERGITLLYD